jgi:hypothetical protein
MPVSTKAAWAVAVVYEDASARERAMDFCDQLVGRFWARFEFEVSWWPFSLIEQPGPATEAASKAARADLVVVAATPEGDFPLHLNAWLDTWLRQRGEREGVLVGLMEAAESPHFRQGPKHRCLRNMAHRGAMDYLTHLPQDLGRTIPDSLDSYTSRAELVTGLLDEILHQPVPPPSPLP